MRTRSVDGEKFNAFLRRACPGNHINPRLYPNQWYFRRFWWFYYTTSGSSIDLFESPSIFQMKERTNLFLNERIFLLLIDFHREIIIESDWKIIILSAVFLWMPGCLISTNSSISLWPGPAAWHPPPLGSWAQCWEVPSCTRPITHANKEPLFPAKYQAWN